jgi:hypothetical protein
LVQSRGRRQRGARRRAHAAAGAHDLGRDHDRDRVGMFEAAWAGALELSQALGASALREALSALRVPGAGSSGEEVRDFSRALQEVMIEQRNLGHDWGFDVDQAKTLEAYFAANHLLADCLDVAYVSNRAAIEESLLLPPGAWRAEEWGG